MKKLIFVGILGLFVLGSCNNSTVTHTHNEHDHATEGHNHEAVMRDTRRLTSMPPEKPSGVP